VAGVTHNYGWGLPTVHADNSTWGAELNTTIGAIDGQMFTNQQSVVAVQNQLSVSQLNLFTVPATSTNAVVVFLNSAVPGLPGIRWEFGAGAGSETGGNAGTNLSLSAYSDTGAFLGQVFTATRSSQRMQIINGPVGPNDVAHKGYVDSVAAPVGSIVMWPQSTPPTGWNFCVGEAVSRTAYPALFALIGTAYGAGDGSTTFNLPNMGSRSPFAWDGTTGIGAVGGETTHTLAAQELPVTAYGDVGHTHPATESSHTHASGWAAGGLNGVGNFAPNLPQPAAGSSTRTDATSATVTVGTGNAAISNPGGGQPHNNMHPYFVIGFIIRCI
jgi:microcystin-dependent protein